jgi:hypothetical protein
MPPAVEIEKDGKTLVLAYRPRDDDEWVQRKFDRGEELTIKGTYHLTKADLHAGTGTKADKDLWEDTPLRFRLGRLRGEYYVVDDGVLDIGTPVWLHKKCTPTWKWFSAERRVSVLGVIAQLRPTRIVIGGPQSDAIPVGEYERLLQRFPTPHELRRYSRARVAAVVREYLDTEVDAERAYQKYVNKRLDVPAANLTEPFRKIDAQKFQLLHRRLETMLVAEETYSETRWQKEILQIIRLLNPRYLHSFEKVRIRDLDAGTTREIDIMLVDASGNIDLVEIKKPFDKSIVSSGTYRDNHIPLRELSGSVMQIEKYIYYLNRWGERGEQELTRRLAGKLPGGFQIRIANPTGIVIIGRDRDLTASQRRDFEIVKRKYKNIADILTYDDLLRRIGFVLQQLSAGT